MESPRDDESALMPPNAPALADAASGSAPQPRLAPEPVARTLDAQDPARLRGKELSGLELDARLLEEARDESLPVLDRLRLLSIFSTKLDELFTVRVAGLKRQIACGVSEPGSDGLLPSEQLDRIAARARELLEDQHATWRDGILPALASGGIRILAPAELSPEQREVARRRFVGSVFPALTPLAVDPGHPFPQLRGRSLSLAASLQRGEGRRRRPAVHPLAVIPVPPMLPRLVRLPSRSGEAYALLEEIIAAGVGDLFPGHAVGETAVFRVTRRRTLDACEPDSDGRPAIPEPERRRDRGAAVRLEISAAASHEVEAALVAALKLEPRDVHRLAVPLQLADLLALDHRAAELR
jgi:polyphosphate kinase